ncbi:site-2 protease family protein [Desulfoluna spongiiphila]|uniref:site-2 protease family protein n=1 Tax=Desulfoluna spongiiphila TaxID=419481 RepID=UPI00125AEC43|nr:site-2 protease family protein [Desulfoluna spongiiphila]VVS90686.1 pdz superfamily [Desulfoluna spongiiphila]
MHQTHVQPLKKNDKAPKQLNLPTIKYLIISSLIIQHLIYIVIPEVHAYYQRQRLFFHSQYCKQIEKQEKEDMTGFGLKVLECDKTSYAAAIGINKDDYIISLNGDTISNIESLKEKIATNADTDIVYEIVRDNEKLQIAGTSKPLGVILQKQPLKTNNATESFRPEYKTAQNVSEFMSGIGWIVAALGGIGAFVSFFSGVMLSIIPCLGLSVSGIFLVAAGQITRATVDNANSTREILSLLKEKA